MCYHISIPEWSDIDSLLDHAIRNDEWEDYFHYLSGFAHAAVPVLSAGQPDRIQAFRWGLIPHWCKDEKQAKEMRAMTLNAKEETLFEKPSFRNCISEKRCLIFVNGFYEWRDYQKKKYPYFIRLKNQSTFALGGIHESWVNKETGELIHTCSIVTTPANALMEKIHNNKKRMPLIFTKAQMKQWIAPGLSKEQIKALMQPLPEGLLEAHTISKLVTSRSEDPNVPEVKAEAVYEELPGI